MSLRLTRLRSLRWRALVALGLGALMLAAGCASLRGDWRTASRAPVGLAPKPAEVREAVVQAYAARTVGWKGAFGVHSWVAVKAENAQDWTVYEVIGWRLRWAESVVVVRSREPDARWFGAEPELLADLRGAPAAALIPRIEAAARSYPWAREYTVWPGPNSNTFVAWIARAVPELGVDLPPTAIGKDYLGERIVATAPSGRGFQVSLGGLLALTASPVEGLEINLLSLGFGLNPFDPALRLPLLGRLGPERGARVAE
ncbi:MAG: DUF3750 domain-containing protein [Betaproteobacteria bacterium]|nr:DUF3750 domain-containing protein [Betaproteobacteria bacterium]